MESTTEGSVVLAGVYLKVGVIGWVRYALAANTSMLHYLTPCIALGVGCGSIAVCAVLGSSVDAKRFAAGSSVLHMQLVLLCLALSQHSLLVVGAMLQLAAHSWIASMLFMYIGEVYETQGSRSSRVHSYAGRSSTAMLLLLLANSGYPTTPSYTAEFLSAGYSGVSGMLAITMLLAALGG